MTDYPKEIFISTGRGEEITDPIARTDRKKAFNIGMITALKGVESLDEIQDLIENSEERYSNEVKILVEKAFRAGLAKNIDTLDGWSNLTQAIKEEADIDWVKLDGLPAKCVHPELGTLTYKLERDRSWKNNSEYPGKYFVSSKNYLSVWASALLTAWYGHESWSLYIKGEIPLKPKTAEQLPVGMCFDGVLHGGWHPMKGVVVGMSDGKKKAVIWGNSTMAETAEKVEVLKEYGIGTFTTEDVK